MIFDFFWGIAALLLWISSSSIYKKFALGLLIIWAVSFGTGVIVEPFPVVLHLKRVLLLVAGGWIALGVIKWRQRS
jgi:hypothetical protein